MSDRTEKLTEEFNRHIGLIIKDPQRVTADMDPAAEIIHDLARENALMVNFIKAGEQEEPFMCDIEAVHVYITKDGVPADKSWGWRVEGFSIEA